MNDAVVTDLRETADAHVGTDDGTGADSSAAPDEHERPDARVRGDDGFFFDAREMMHAGRRVPWIGEELDRPRERQIGIPGPQHRQMRAVSRLARDDRGRVRLFELRDVLGIREERELPGLCVLERCHAGDLDRAVAFEAATKTVGNLLQFHVETALRWKKLSRCSRRRASAMAWTRDSRAPGSSVSTRRSSVSGALVS